MITTIKLINTFTSSHNLFVCVCVYVGMVRTLNIYSQTISIVQYNIINYSHHAIY